jgi:hypothetical protein
MLRWTRRSFVTTATWCRVLTTPGEHPEFDYAAAREWYKTYSPLTDIGDVTYARASGPGGQNVNK